eukprot:TRINITY_DN1564_c0_g1_i5.p1 TRINITY_DN1564_c0_g1~~TRINITY_DN1564_c0_g1_i5.p1  ORF type:complete len:754 (+),score=271.92 TRINITY_DN1564_c0_g1_i5:166-2262(+)
MSTQTGAYEQAYRQSLDDPEAFWGKAAEKVVWTKRWDTVVPEVVHNINKHHHHKNHRAGVHYSESEVHKLSRPGHTWFPGAQLNVCYNAVDLHVLNGHGNSNAIFFDSPITNTQKAVSFAELLDLVSRLAGVLRELGVKKGDRVLGYMPTSIEATTLMLACARIGAIHSMVFGGFAPHELAKRITDAKPKLIVASTCGIEKFVPVPYMPLVDKALELSGDDAPSRCLVFQRPECRAELKKGRDVDWDEMMATSTGAPCESVEASHPLYILHTSGTTGAPKGVVRDSGSYAVALKWAMSHIFGTSPGDVTWTASDVGWVLGHSFMTYGPLLQGCSTILYEGKPVGTPDASAFWRVLEQYKANTFFCAPTALRAIKREDPTGSLVSRFDLSHLRGIFLAGERADPDTVKWVGEITQKPIIDNFWQTETGWPIISNYLGLEQFPLKTGSATKPVPGYDVQILDKHHHPLKADELGDICIRLPLPPGCFPTLWNNEEGYVKSYLKDHPGFYSTGDCGFKDSDGYVHIMTRTGDVINIAGHRLSTGGMEEVLSSHKLVAECAVVGVDDELKGQVPIGLVVLKDVPGQAKSHHHHHHHHHHHKGHHSAHDNEPLDQHAFAETAKELNKMVREDIGPIATLKHVIVVNKLPKTKSGKILRKVIRLIATGSSNWEIPPTCEDIDAVHHVAATLRLAGLSVSDQHHK